MTGDESGEVFGPYVLRSLLGRGGMGEVWHAHHTVLDREVALKRISGAPAQDAELRARFRREARLAARLSSAHVVPIHDFGEIDDQLFLDMRLVPGPDLRTVLDRHPDGLAPALVRDIVVQLADALDAAHEQELVHRDVKPSNVLVDLSRGRWFCYLADFGVAVPVAGDTRITRTGMTVGTPTYMAPELLVGDGRAGVASDVYALGCLLHELLTGRPPFTGATDAAVLYQHVHAEPPRPSDSRPWLAGFDAVVWTALAKEPVRRFATAGELAGALPSAVPQAGPPVAPDRTAATPGPIGYRPPPGPPALSGPYPPSPGGPRRRGLLPIVALVAVVVLLVGLGVGAYLWTTGPRAAESVAAPPVPPAAVTVRPLRAFTYTYGVTASPDGRTVWAVADGGDGSDLYGIDAATGDVTVQIEADGRANKLVLSPDGTRAYLTAPGSDTSPGSLMQVVDLVGRRVVADVQVGGRPLFEALSPDGSRLYVGVRGPTDDRPGTVAVVDTTRNTVVGTVPVGVHPSGIAVSPDGRTVYVAERGTAGKPGGTVAVIDTTTLRIARSLPTRPTPYGIALTRDGRTLYVATNSLDPVGTLDVFDTGSFAATQAPAPTTSRTAAVALTPDGRRLLLVNIGSDKQPGSTVSVLDVTGGAGLPAAQIGGIPRDIAVTPDGRHAFVVTAERGGRVLVLDLP